MIISNGVGLRRNLSGIEAFGAELIAVSDSGNINKYDTSTNSLSSFLHYQSLLSTSEQLGII
jgi:hypothetical protein